MTLHGEALARDEVPSDTNLWALLRLQRITERIGESNSATKPPVFDSEVMTFNFDMNVQISQNELQNWRAATSPTVKNLRKSPLIRPNLDQVINMNYQHSSLYLNDS